MFPVSSEKSCTLAESQAVQWERLQGEDEGIVSHRPYCLLDQSHLSGNHRATQDHAIYEDASVDQITKTKCSPHYTVIIIIFKPPKLQI